MALFKEPKEVDLSTKSEPWTEEELLEFRLLMQELKRKNSAKSKKNIRTKSKPTPKLVK